MNQRVMKAVGFGKDEWVTLGYSEMPGDCKNTLTYRRHPIFQTLYDDYPTFDPVLRLASAVLESPASVAFIYTIMYGSREKLADLSQRLGQDCYNIRRCNETESVVRKLVFEALDKMHILWELADPQGTESYLMSTGSIDEEEICITNGGRRGLASKITIRKGFLTELDRLTAKDKDLPLLNLQFMIAKNLCHEIAHAVNYAVSFDAVSEPGSGTNTRSEESALYEPFYEDQRQAELGYAYENEVFGGVIQPYTLLTQAQLHKRHVEVPGSVPITSPEIPLYVCKWPSTASDPSWPERRHSKKSETTYCISMHFIYNIQQQSFWERNISRTADTSILRISKTIGIREKAKEGTEIDPTWTASGSSEGQWSADSGDIVRRGGEKPDAAVYSAANRPEE